MMKIYKDIFYPENSINLLVEFALKNAEEIDGYYLKHHGRFRPVSERIYIVIEGRIRIDHAKTSKTLGVFVRKMLLGVIEQSYDLEHIIYSCSKDTSLISVDARKFYDLLQEEKILHHVIVVSTYFIARLIECINIVMAKNSYTIIKGLVERYDSFQRLPNTPKESLVSFILSRSTLSRSLVMKVLADLRKGDYIITNEDGTLIINKKLPAEY